MLDVKGTHYCTISTTSSVTGHKRPWTEPMYKIVTVTGGPWTCYETRRLFIIIKLIMFCRLQRACYVCHALGCHFCTISTSKHRYFVGQIVIIYEPWTCRELEKIPSRITPAYEPMNLGVHGVTGHTPWTCGRNGTVIAEGISWWIMLPGIFENLASIRNMFALHTHVSHH